MKTRAFILLKYFAFTISFFYFNSIDLSNTQRKTSGLQLTVIRQKWDSAVYAISFIFEVLQKIFTFHKERNISTIVLIRQILFTGYEAVGIILLMAVSIGGIIIIEGNAILPGFPQSKIFYNILVSVVTRELGCLLTAFIIIARSGTAIATELGNMVVNKEIDALLSFGISPVSYLVVPRIFGVVISIVTLSLYFNAAAIIGAWLISAFFAPVNLPDYLYLIFSELTIKDIASSVLKAFSFGFAAASIASYQGLRVNNASTEVPQQTIKAVVKSLTAVILLDVIITVLFYFS
ncbi:MAG: ABC transporter permease [Ignavibacteria bacterium]|nr:ABC transporter permease [Ignavibacteria bacterium]